MTATETDYPNIEYVKGGFKVGRKTFRYRVNGEPCNSVTEILEWTFGEGKFGAGAWWGQSVGIEALAALQDQGFRIPLDDPAAVLDLIKAHKRTTNHVRDKAGDRGTAIHAVAERYARDRVLPNAKEWPPNERGYVEALCAWLIDTGPTFHATEVVVGSAEYGYAGTYDARISYNGSVGIIDYKTSKRIYDSVMFQLAAYELAAVECGASPTDFQAAVHLKPDGTYDMEPSKVTADQWIAQLDAFKSQQQAKADRKRK